jgi:hypothetical protein
LAHRITSLSRSISVAYCNRYAFGGTLKDIPAANLGAVAVGAAVARAKLRPDEVETVVMGNGRAGRDHVMNISPVRSAVDPRCARKLIQLRYAVLSEFIGVHVDAIVVVGGGKRGQRQRNDNSDESQGCLGRHGQGLLVWERIAFAG